MGRLPTLVLYEDNEAAQKIIRSGKFPAMRHEKRVHGVSVMSLHDMEAKKLFKMSDCHTKAQAADIFTKHFINQLSWEHDLSLIGVLS